MRAHVLTSREGLVAAAGAGDTFARLDPPERLTGWAGEGAVAYVRTSARRGPSLTAWGPQVVELLRALMAEDLLAGHRFDSVTAPFADREAVGELFEFGYGGDWEWMWTASAPPPVAGEERLIALDDTADAALLEDFGLGENPRFEGFPGTGHSSDWLGVRDADGALLACGAVQRLPSGVAHLGGIVVAGHVRRQGLGRAVSAALTRRVVATEGVCTLGLYADNRAARALYDSLGYVVDKKWTSRLLARD